MTRIEADCRLMIAEAAIEYASETDSPFVYDNMAFWLAWHNLMCNHLYGAVI